MQEPQATTFDTVLCSYPWEPIPGCEGRFRLAGPLSALAPSELAVGLVSSQTFRVPTARDPVVVAVLADGSGLISYQKPGGMYVHTLCTPAKLQLRLEQLGIVLPTSPGHDPIGG